MNTIQVQCCVVGGGPAGMMLGYLMARAGVETVVLEKHKDFLRDFRGDTVHPSTTQIMQDLGLLEEFLTLPHQKVSKMHASIQATTLARSISRPEFAVTRVHECVNTIQRTCISSLDNY